MELTDRNWKEFEIYEIFEHKRGKRQISENRKKGKIPYYSASKEKNGLTDLISNPSFIIDTDALIYTTFGDAYYVKAGFSCSDEITILTNKKLNKYNGLFLCSCIDKNRNKYCFGRKAFSNKIGRDKILVPVTDSMIPDYDFMTNYIKEKFFDEIVNVKNYCYNRLKEINKVILEPFNEKKWLPFKLNDVCIIQSGIDIYDSERINGKIPYITSASINNGIKYFVSNINKTICKNSISVNRNGSVGYAFYHKYDALYSNDCRKLTVKKCNNEYVSLFITNQIMQQKEKYGYGYKMGTARLQKQNILLPVDELNEPDYEYMEQYIKNIMFEQYSRYLQFLED